MRGYTVGSAHRRESVTPYIEIWEQPFLPWLIAIMYQLWESYSFRLMAYLSKWHRKFFFKNNDYVPLLARQDHRCTRLTQKRRTRLVVAYITQDQFDILVGDLPVTEEPRHEVKEPIVLA